MIRKKPSEADRRYIIGRSGGRCNICREALFIEGEFGERIRLGDDAHIFAASRKGPRGIGSATESDRARAQNLMLLCKTCHSKVDQQPENFSASRLADIRDQHYFWVEQSLGSHIIRRPRFHYLSYINVPRVDMYATATSVSLPYIDLGNAKSVRDLGMGAGRLMAAYVGALNHEDLSANILSKAANMESLLVGSYWYFDTLSFRARKVLDTSVTVEAWKKRESIIYRNFRSWKLFCQIDPRWITTSTSYTLLTGGTLETTGLIHINHVDYEQRGVTASPLFLGAPDRGQL